MPLASVTPLDASSKAPADSDDVVGDLDDTAVNEELTVNMHEDDGTIEIVVDDETAAVPAKKGKAS